MITDHTDYHWVFRFPDGRKVSVGKESVATEVEALALATAEPEPEVTEVVIPAFGFAVGISDVDKVSFLMDGFGYLLKKNAGVVGNADKVKVADSVGTLHEITVGDYLLGLSQFHSMARGAWLSEKEKIK